MKPAPFKYGKEPNTDKYLIVCDGGNVRSVALATTLKLNYGIEAIAIGRLYMTPETMRMLSEWADVIVLTEAHMMESIPDYCQIKCTSTIIGQDRWGIYINPELNILVNNEAEKLLGGEL